MLGLVRGRVYYNLLNWYRALSLLPGYSVNRAFMERMMGVREKLADPPAPPYTAGKARDALRLLRMSGRLVREYQRLPREIARFHRRVEETLGPFACRDLTECPVEDLLALYRRVERELLTRWRAPLVNDFFAMIAFGLLGRLVERWLPGSPATLINDLLSGEGGIISTEPARRLRTLAEQVRECPRLSRLFAGSDPAAVWRELRTNPEMHEFRSRIEAYLEQFGERCANELKLETVTLREDPTLLIELLKAYAERPLPEQAGAAVRRAAEDELAAQVRGMRRLILLLVLRETRKRVRDRENLRFERTRVFGLARRIFLALGAHLGQSRRLESERDIFYLTREEVFGAFEGTGVTADLTALVRLRRAEFEGYAQEPPPPDRFETFGTQYTTPASPEPSREERGQLSGTGCCPGIVRAPVRVVRDPAQAGDLRDCILVAERTDPGWTVLFPLARGLLVQRGSLLSHSAIVAREIGLPCIVGIAGLMGALRDGEWVEMDGTTGRLHRVEAGK
jgi:pyruvate,water dikinase